MGVVVFVMVAFSVLDRGPLLAEDSAVRTYSLSHHSATLTTVLTAVSTAAAVPVLVTAMLTLGVCVARRTKRRDPLVLGGCAVVLFGASVGAGKLLMGRARPPAAPTDLFSGGSSFPSGHTTGIVVLGGLALLLISPHLQAAGRWVLGVAAGLMAIIVGVSRLYLDQHWLTDVLASWALGVLIACALTVLAPRLSTWPLTSKPLMPGDLDHRTEAHGYGQ